MKNKQNILLYDTLPGEESSWQRIFITFLSLFLNRKNYIANNWGLGWLNIVSPIIYLTLSTLQTLPKAILLHSPIERKDFLKVTQ